MNWAFLLIGLEFPAVLALIDCINRDDDDFEGGAADHQAWVRWLVPGVLLAWAAVGYAVVLGYYFVVVRRNSFSRP